MDRCREIYERIVAQGKVAIEGFVVDRRTEELFLDFKRSSNNGTEPRLSDNDRKNLAKAISGFGNSEGGVIIWGVDCSADKDGADVAKALVALENPKRFVSLIQGAISGCTVPPHSRVENHAIEIEGGKGFVVTLIPKSNSAPHQTLPNRQYYIRAGSDFVPTPHDVLAGMFGRRPQPHVFHHFLLSIPSLEDDVLKVSFGVAVHNEGSGIASDIFLVCLLQELPGPNCTMQFDPPDRTNWTGGWEFGRQISLISAPGYRLPPGANAQPVVVHLHLAPPFEHLLKISGSVGSGQSQKYEFLIESPGANIAKQYEEYLTIARTGSFRENQQHEIASAILGTTKITSEA